MGYAVCIGIDCDRDTGRDGCRRVDIIQIQSRRIAYSGELVEKRLPPSCGTCPAAFLRIKLSSGSLTATRRPRLSRVSVCRSIAGDSPRRLSLKPPLPFKFPWQGPELHPVRESTGMTSFWNDGVCAEAGSSQKHNEKSTRRPRMGGVTRAGVRITSMVGERPSFNQEGYLLGERRANAPSAAFFTIASSAAARYSRARM